MRLIELVTHTAATAIIKERAEKNLRGSEERFRTLVEQASDAIFVHDLEGRLLDVNRSACESLGYAREELLRMTVTDIEQGIPLGRTCGRSGRDSSPAGRRWCAAGTGARTAPVSRWKSA